MQVFMVLCPGCQSKLKVPSGSSGTITLRCPQCGKPFSARIAEPPSPPASSSEPPTVDAKASGETAPYAPAPDPAATIDAAPSAGPSPGTLGGETMDEVVRAPGVAPTSARKVLPSIPGYEVLEELGRGGMGVVYKARQINLKRLVALKMILAGDSAGEQELTRFRTEAEAVAHLHHPHIVQIYEIGEHEGRSFFSLEFVDGGSLSGRLQAGRLAPAEAARLTELLARAVQHAHQRGVIHRDLKPANVLLMEDGTPKITDFGLAKRLQEQNSAQTRSGAVMGTPSYMAPEQALGKSHEIGPAVDVYALGAVLYELLTGRPPFRGETVMATLHQVIHDEPLPPSKHLPKLDRDLETICLKALAKAPSQRYASALELAQDLERQQAGQPILARRAGVLRRLARRARRHLAAGIVAAVLVLLAGAAAVAIFSVSSTRQVSALVGQIEAGLDAGSETPQQGEHLEALLTQLEPLDPARAASLRQRLHERFAQAIQEHLHAARLGPEAIEQVETDIAWLEGRDGPRAAQLRSELQDRLARWQELFHLRAPFDTRAGVFPPELLAVRDERLHPAVKSGANLVPLSVIPTQVASGGAVQLEAEFDASWQDADAVGLALNHQPAHQGTIHAVAFSPDGKLVYSAGQDRVVRIWETTTGREVRALRDHPDGISSLIVSPDGKKLAIALYNSEILLRDAATGEKLATARHQGVRCLAFSTDGKRLASGSWDKEVAVWDASTLGQLLVLKDNPHPLQAVAFGPGDDTLTAVTIERAVAVWDLAARKARWVRTDTVKTQWRGFALSRDARTLALGGSERNLLCDPATGKEKGTIPLEQEAGIVAVDVDCRRFAIARDRSLHVVSLSGGRDEQGHVLDEHHPITTLALAPGGGLVAVGLQNGQLILWDVLRKGIHWRQGGEGYVFLLASNYAQPSKEAQQGPQGATARRPASFATARSRGVSFEMRLLRNGMILRKKAVHVPAGPLQLLASRVGERLEFQVGRGERLTFHDVVPLTSGPAGVFGVHWPPAAALTSLRATALTLPPAPSPLEEADDLFEKGRYGDALALYRKQLAAASDPAIKQEAQCRAGLCLVQLNRLDEAAQQFAPLINGEGERWPLIAACQLWMIHLQQKKYDDLDTLLTTLSARFDREQLSSYVPAQLRQDALFRAQISVNNYLLVDPTLIRRAEAHVALARFFQDAHGILWGRYALAQLLATAGQEDRALPLLRECVEESEADLHARGHMSYELLYPVRWYTWLLRRSGANDEALRVVDRCLFDEAGRPRWQSGSGREKVGEGDVLLFLALYLDRARTHAARGEWQLAEADLDDMARQLPPGTTYQFYASCLLMKGFLCERRGDAAGAMRAWKQGTYRAYLAQQPPEVRSRMSPLAPEGQREAWMHNMIMAALTDELTDADAEKMMQSIVKLVGSDPFVTQVIRAINFHPSVLRAMWLSPRGRDVARRIAFLELSSLELVRFPVFLSAVQKCKQDILTGEPTAEVEEQFWQIISSLGSAILDGRLRKAQAIQISLAYKGTTSFLGWQGVAPTLEPDMRAKLAYLLGHRYTRLNRPQDAQMFFRTAAADAPKDSVLRKLAEAELGRTTPKK